MADEVKKVEGGADTANRVKSLEDELALEKAKNEVLMEQALKAENGLAEKDVEGFADVIPNEDREFWRGPGCGDGYLVDLSQTQGDRQAVKRFAMTQP